MGSKRYIPQGAILICDKGRDMTHLRVTHNNNVNLYKVPYANEFDRVPEENIPNFKKCEVCGNCQMDLLEWSPVHESVKIGGGKLIHEDSRLKCKKGGEIKIYLNENEAKEALKQTAYNKLSWQEKAKRVDWGTVGKTLATAFVVAAVGAALFATGGAIVAAGAGILTAKCAAVGVVVELAGLAIKGYAMYQTVKGVYETYKRMEAANWDIEEGLVVLAEHIGSAAGALAGGAIGNKIGGMLSDKIYAKSSIYQKMKNGTICFIAGTLVSTRLGRKRIDEIEKGDEVYSYEELTGQKVLRKVRDVHEHITDTFVRIKTKTEEILTTPEHPFYVKGRYILASFLSAGMSLTGFAGEQIEIQETEIIRYEIPKKVYNFSIEGTENYYVGEQGVLAHNAGGCPSGNEVKKKNTETDEHIVKENRRKVLAKNAEYTKNGYDYKTDELGRIKEAKATELRLEEGKRKLYSQRKVGGQDRLDIDDGGHLFRTQFGGSGDIDNLIPQNSKVNRSGGEWYNMEEEWVRALKETPPKKVSVKINPIYEGNSMRPTEIEVRYKIGKGKTKFRTIPNPETI